MYLCWEIGAIDLMITIDDVSFWFIWTQNWDSWHGAHKLDNSLGEMMMLLYFDSLFFCRSRIFLQYGNIILCMLQPKSYVLLGCSGRIFSTDIRSVDHPKPLYFNLLIYFASSCAIHCLFFCGGCLFCWNSVVTVFHAVARFWLKNTWNLGRGLCKVCVIRIMYCRWCRRILYRKVCITIKDVFHI